MAAAIAYAEDWISTALTAMNLGTPIDPIDVDRRYLFGYSNGGMMAYRLANGGQFPEGYWAALWVFAGTIGGRRYDLANTVVNSPQGPSTVPEGVSLFAHHGTFQNSGSPALKALSEFTVPPGLTTTTTAMSKSLSYQWVLEDAGLGSVDAAAITVEFMPLRRAIKEYLDRNNAAFGAFPITDQTPTQTQNSQPDLAGGNTSTRLTWRRTGTTNPEVVEYRDPALGHTTYWAGGATQYFSVGDIWDWLMAHPRTTT